MLPLNVVSQSSMKTYRNFMKNTKSNWLLLACHAISLEVKNRVHPMKLKTSVL
jgi:hypothetical protein